MACKLLITEIRPKRREEARRTLRYVEPLSEARTKLTDFSSILLDLTIQDDEDPKREEPRDPFQLSF